MLKIQTLVHYYPCNNAGYVVPGNGRKGNDLLKVKPFKKQE
jgi:hypothetical protein